MVNGVMENPFDDHVASMIVAKALAQGVDLPRYIGESQQSQAGVIFTNRPMRKVH